MYKTHTGFTILEILLVVGMMAMIMTAIGFNLFAGLAKGRDTRRVQDMNALKEALQLSFVTYHRYPVHTTEIEITGSDPVNTLLLTDRDLRGAIKDPVGGASYKYWYRSDIDGISYQLRFCLETSQVPNYKKGCDPKNIMTP